MVASCEPTCFYYVRNASTACRVEFRRTERLHGDLRGAVFAWIKAMHHKAGRPAPIDDAGLSTNSFGVADLFGNVCAL
jgi:hypothetical protein